jgi:hypothetical protein
MVRILPVAGQRCQIPLSHDLAICKPYVFKAYGFHMPQFLPPVSALVSFPCSALRYSGQFRSVITTYFAQYEPDLLRQRRANHLKCKHFWSTGVNNIWTLDQHDKWTCKFGLALHSFLEPFVGRIQWLKIWWTNSNPCLTLSYYLDTVEESGERLCLGLSTAVVLLITWTNEWNAAGQATTTNRIHILVPPGCTSLDVPTSIHAF